MTLRGKMTVKDLQDKLSKFESDLEILIFSESENICPDGYSARVLEIMDVKQIKANTDRDSNGVVFVKFDNREYAKDWLCIEMTFDL